MVGPVVDIEPPGPDQEQGSKCLILPAGYGGDIPERFFIAESPSYSNWPIDVTHAIAKAAPEASRHRIKHGRDSFGGSNEGFSRSGVYPIRDVWARSWEPWTK